MSRRGESIYKRKDGRWEARYVQETDNGRKKKIVSVYGKTYTEAKNKRYALLKNNSDLSLSVQLNSSLNFLLREWLRHNQSRLKASSYQKYEGIIRNHVENSIGKMNVSDLTKPILTKYAQEQLLRGNVMTGGSLSPGSVNLILSFIASAIDWAGGYTYSFNMPYIKCSFSKTEIFTPEEQKRLEEYIKNNLNGYTLGVLLALYTGLRIGELCALQWTDIVDGVINVHKTMQRIKSDEGAWNIIISTPKTLSSQRFVPVPAELYLFLKTFRRSSGFILLQENGRFIEPRLLQKKFIKILDQIELAQRPFHSLRHTFATRLIEKGGDAKTVSALLGHSSVQITLNRYVHPSLNMKRQTIDKMSFTDKINA